MSLESLELKLIRLDGDTQPRVEMSFALVEEYAEEMVAGAEFPPVSVVHDGSNYWLYDGFHRFSAASLLGRDRIAAEVKDGTLEQAQWESLSANKSHGLRRSNKDKVNAVIRALEFKPEETAGLIAEHVGVSKMMVSKYRSKAESTVNGLQSRKRRGVDGRWYEAKPPKAQGDHSRTPAEFPHLQMLNPLQDSLNRPFPEHQQSRMQAVFAARQPIHKFDRQLREIGDAVFLLEVEGGEAFKPLQDSPFYKHVESAAALLKSLCPYAVCTDCRGDGCGRCNNRGWMDEHSWRELEDKPAAKDSAKPSAEAQPAQTGKKE